MNAVHFLSPARSTIIKQTNNTPTRLQNASERKVQIGKGACGSINITMYETRAGYYNEASGTPGVIITNKFLFQKTIFVVFERF